MQSKTTHQPEGEDLSGGARIVCSVAADGLITLAIWRFGKEVGLIEEQTFKRHAGVPDWAERSPFESQWQSPASDGSGTWYAVTYHWLEEENQGG